MPQSAVSLPKSKKKTPLRVEVELCDKQRKVVLQHRLLKKRLDWVAQHLVERFPKKIPLHVEFVFLDAKSIAQVHESFMGDPTPTDVITFQHGEIVICPEVAVVQAKQYKKKTGDEVLLYGIHGLLHLAGYNDVTPQGFKKMKAAQERLLKTVVGKVPR